MGWFNFRKKDETPASSQAPAPAPAPAPAFSSVPVDSKFLSQLRPYVSPPELLPPALAAGAPQVLPGIVMVVAVDNGNQVNFLPTSSMIELLPRDRPNRDVDGPEYVRQLAIDNLCKLPLPPVHWGQASPGRTDTDVALLEQQDSFVASRIMFFKILLERVFPGKSREHGVLLAIPRRRTLLLHLPCGIGMLRALDSMSATANVLFEQSTQSRLSPNVYFVAPDGTAEIVASPRNGNEVVINMSDKLGNVLRTFGKAAGLT